MIRCVLDTDVSIAAMRSSKGASSAILLHVLDRKIELLASVPLALEYEAKCLLKEHWQAGGLTESQAHLFLDSVIALATPVHLDFYWRPLLHDPADEMVLETAINGKADYLISFNLRNYGNAPAAFGIKILRPSEFLKEISQ